VWWGLSPPELPFLGKAAKLMLTWPWTRWNPAVKELELPFSCSVGQIERHHWLGITLKFS